MDSIVLTWRELLIAAIVILGVYIAEVLLLLRHGRSPALRLWRGARKASEPSFAIGPLKQEISKHSDIGIPMSQDQTQFKLHVSQCVPGLGLKN